MGLLDAVGLRVDAGRTQTDVVSEHETHAARAEFCVIGQLIVNAHGRHERGDLALEARALGGCAVIREAAGAPGRR